MRKMTILFCLMLLCLPFGHKALTQGTPKAPDAANPAPPPFHYYHLEFVIQELSADDKPVNSRTYSTTVSTDKMANYGQIRTGSRIPIITGTRTNANGSEKSDAQFQYVDIGVSVDVQGNVREIDNQLSFNLVAEVSSLGSNPGPLAPNDPIIRQNKWQAPVLIPIGKPTVVFKSDDLDTKGSMQVTVKATLLQ